MRVGLDGYVGADDSGDGTFDVSRKKSPGAVEEAREVDGFLAFIGLLHPKEVAELDGWPEEAD